MIISNKRITKVLIRLHLCTGWAAPLLFANLEDRFARNEAHMKSNCFRNRPEIEECHAIIYAFLRLWYKFKARKFSHFVRFTFRIK